jgi:hypothetical protein
MLSTLCEQLCIFFLLKGASSAKRTRVMRLRRAIVRQNRPVAWGTAITEASEILPTMHGQGVG